jgi:hypothetical protein
MQTNRLLHISQSITEKSILNKSPRSAHINFLPLTNSMTWQNRSVCLKMMYRLLFPSCVL